jgi:hypothetical protein
MEQQICKIDRWRYVGQGDLGHIWEDTANGRFVISDAIGPGGVSPAPQGGGGRRGAHHHDYTKQFQQGATQ